MVLVFIEDDLMPALFGLNKLQDNYSYGNHFADEKTGRGWELAQAGGESVIQT